MYLEYSAQLCLLRHTSWSDSKSWLHLLALCPKIILSSLLLLQKSAQVVPTLESDQVLHGGAFVFARLGRSNAKLCMHFSDSAWFESNYPHNIYPTAIRAGMFYIISQMQHKKKQKKRIISQNVCLDDFKNLDPGFKSSLWTTTKMLTTPNVSRVNNFDSLEGEGATIQLLGSAKTSLFGWGAAEQQELVGGVHEFQLLWQ